MPVAPPKVSLKTKDIVKMFSKLPATKKADEGRIFFGLDPGKSGGITVIDTEAEGGGTSVLPIAIPETPHDLWKLFASNGWSHNELAVAVLEKVSSSPQQGVTSAFSFGRSYERLVMMLTVAHIPFEEISPQTWQKALGITPRKKGKKVGKKVVGEETYPQFKKRLRAFTQRLFPTLPIWSEKMGVQLAVCDSILIAEYCRRKHTGLLK